MAIKNEIRSQLEPDLVIRPIPEEVRRQALEGIPKLRALRKQILARIAVLRKQIISGKIKVPTTVS